MPQTCSQSATAAEATTPQQRPPPHSDQSEHLNIIHKCKVLLQVDFQSLRGGENKSRRMRESTQNIDNRVREGTELADIYKFIVGEMVE